MLSFVRSALQARRAAIREAEALVLQFGAGGSAMAEALASDPSADEARRAHYRRVARIARRRHDFLAGLDTATRYEVVNAWRSRDDAEQS